MASLLQIDLVIEDKANKGIGEALFSYGKELYQFIRQEDKSGAVKMEHL